MAFNHAHHFGIENANIHNNFFLPPALHAREPTEILLGARAVEATHTSTTASYAPKCNPETRVKVIGDIADWVVGLTEAPEQAAATRMSILWFSGPAGGGKTCIMRSVIDRSEGAGLSALSYFFSTRGGLSEERPFVATIVDQLITFHPALRPRVIDTIRNRPGIFGESLDVQMDKLIIEPLESQDFRSQPIPRRPKRIVIVVDGFDECDSEHERGHLLSLLLSLVSRLPHLIIVVLASRPELDIRTAFEDPKTLKNITKVVRLHEYGGMEDVRIYLCDEFEKIRTTHPLRHSIPADWPLEEIVQILLDKSTGNFIYPATVIKYIQNPRRNPVDLLKEVLGVSKAPTPGNANPLAELDALYYHILHPADTTDPALMKRILHCIIGITGSLPRVGPAILSPSNLDQFLGLPSDTTRTILCDLHSLLSVPDPDKTSPIRLHHKSLEDYLLSERSLDMFQSRYDTHLDLTMVCIGYARRWAKNPVVDTSVCLYYSSLYWADNLRLCLQNKPASAILPDAIVNLDPRFILGYMYVHGFTDPFSELAEMLKGPLLSHPELQGSRLRRLVTRMAHCERKMSQRPEFLDRDARVARLNALARFEHEIGLYAHPRSRKPQRPPLEAEVPTSSLPPPSSPSMTPPRKDRAANRRKRRFNGTHSSSQDVVESGPGVPTSHVVSGNAQNLRSPLEAEDSTTPLHLPSSAAMTPLLLENLRPPKSQRPFLQAGVSTSSIPLPRSAATTPLLLEDPVQRPSRVVRAANRIKRWFSGTRSRTRLG